jgi:hypothetical protein
MEIVTRPLALSSTSDGFGWRCTNQRCPKRHTYRTIPTGSFFEKSRVPLGKWLYIIYLWSHQTKVSTTVKQVEIGEKTVIQMFQYLRDVCTTKLLNTPIQLGGQDVVKAKYRFKEMKGVSSHLLPSYLEERMWRDHWSNCGNQAFGNILQNIAEQNLV